MLHIALTNLLMICNYSSHNRTFDSEVVFHHHQVRATETSQVNKTQHNTLVLQQPEIYLQH